MTKHSLPLALTAALISTAAGAQEPDTTRVTPLPALEWELRTDGTYIDNFFQAPAVGAEVDVYAAGAQVQAALPFARGAGHAYLRAGATGYDQFSPSLSFTAGGRWNSGKHYFDGLAAARLRNPRVEVGGGVGSANLYLASGSYSIRPVRSLELSALVDYYQGRYNAGTERDHDYLAAGGSVRYRGFGYEFMPEVGALMGRLDVRTDTEDYREQTLWVGASSLAIPKLYLSARYRHRARDYVTDDATSSSFQREDSRHQLTFVGDYGLGGPWGLVAYYSLENADSTTPSRVFTTSLIVAGLTYSFGG